jgi:hypothetical protein
MEIGTLREDLIRGTCSRAFLKLVVRSITHDE